MLGLKSLAQLLVHLLHYQYEKVDFTMFLVSSVGVFRTTQKGVCTTTTQSCPA